MKYYRAMFRLYAARRSRSLDSLLLVVLLYVTSYDMEIRQIVSLRFFVWEISVLLLSLLYYKVIGGWVCGGREKEKRMNEEEAEEELRFFNCGYRRVCFAVCRLVAVFRCVLHEKPIG